MFAAPALSPEETSVRSAIKELHEEFAQQLNTGDRWVAPLRRATLARSAQASFRIDDLHVSIDDVAAMAAGEKPQNLSPDSAKAIGSHLLATHYVAQLARGGFDLDASILRSLHFMLTAHDPSKLPGCFRTGPAQHPLDASDHTPPQGAVGEQAESMLKAFAATTSAPASSGSDPLITAAMTHLFIALIQPFTDSNGRMARIAHSLMLGKADPGAQVSLGIEEHLGRHASAYHEAIAQVRKDEWNGAIFDAERARPWIRFILTAHFNQAMELKQRIAATQAAGRRLEPLAFEAGLAVRTLEALYAAMLGGSVTRARYMAALEVGGTPISEQTATRDLSALVEAGLLISHGDKRGRSYTSGEPVQAAAYAAGIDADWKGIDPFA